MPKSDSSDLTPRDRAIEACVKAHLAAGGKVTIAQVAAEAGASRAAVWRFAQKMGCANWSDYVARASRLAHSADAAAPSSRLEQGISMMADALDRHRGGIVLVASCGDAEVCEQHALLRLTALGYLVLPFSPAAAHAHASAGAPGLALIFNESGIAMWECCRICAKEGYEVAAVTANADSPVARSANVSITIKDRKSPLTAYEPNFFAAGAVAFMSRAIARMRDGGAAPAADKGYLSSGQ